MPNIRPEFTIATLTEEATNVCDEIAAALSAALNVVERHLPKGREHALVITKLQEAQQWAERGIAQVSTNQEP